MIVYATKVSVKKAIAGVLVIGALLESYGWKVEAEPRSEREVQIPKTFDDTYQAYNAIQLGQGLDLTPYQGKRARSIPTSCSNTRPDRRGLSPTCWFGATG